MARFAGCRFPIVWRGILLERTAGLTRRAVLLWRAGIARGGLP